MQAAWTCLLLCAVLAASQVVSGQGLTADWTNLQDTTGSGVSADWSHLQAASQPATVRTIDPWDFGLLCVSLARACF